MHGNPGRYDRGWSAALVLYLGAYCALAAGLAFGAYELMQPSRHANPGLAAYKPPPATVIGYGPPSRHIDTAAPALAEPETVAAAEAQQPAPAEATLPAPEVKQAKVEHPKPKRQVRRREWRDPMMNYAAQPYYGYRSTYAAQPFYGNRSTYAAQPFGYRPF